MGIHYDYKSKRGERAMLKEAKRKARLAQRRAKRMLASNNETVEKEEIKTHVRIPYLSPFSMTCQQPTLCPGGRQMKSSIL